MVRSKANCFIQFHWRRKQLIVGGAKVIVGAMAPLSYAGGPWPPAPLPTPMHLSRSLSIKRELNDELTAWCTKG